MTAKELAEIIAGLLDGTGDDAATYSAYVFPGTPPTVVVARDPDEGPTTLYRVSIDEIEMP